MANEDDKDTPTPRLQRVKKDEKTVKVVITKFGHGLVSTGEHVSSEGDVMAERGDQMEVSLSTAQALEKKGFAEIVEEKKAK